MSEAIKAIRREIHRNKMLDAPVKPIFNNQSPEVLFRGIVVYSTEQKNQHRTEPQNQLALRNYIIICSESFFENCFRNLSKKLLI